MIDNDLPVLFYWKYSTDGTVETNWPETTGPEKEFVPNTELQDIDKYIAESTGIYRMFWHAYKRNHPDRVHYP